MVSLTWTKKFIPSCIEFLNIIVPKSDREQISVIQYCIMSASNSKIVVDHEGDLSSSQKPSSFWAFCSSRLTFFLKWEFWMILFRAEAIFASSISKFGKSLPSIDHDDVNSSNESTIPTYVIHNIASDGKPEQVVT